MRTFIVAVFVLFALAPVALAQTQTGVNNYAQTGVTNTVTLINPLGAGTDLPKLLGEIMDFVVNIGSIIVIFMLVYVGYLFVVAQGSDTKLTAAKQALLWTVVGALILLGAKAISAGIQATVQALSTGG